MLSGVTGSVLWLALATALLLGVGGPLVRIAERMGISPKDYVFINFVVGPIIGIMLLAGRGQPLFSSIAQTPKGALLAVLATVILNLSFVLMTTALHLPEGHVSVFFMVTSSSVIVSSMIGLLFLGESDKINLLSWSVGAAMILGGAFLVVNSLSRQ
ncbi:MAG: EamA family transporter [Candidatus Yanofskybacteria bacterium]|nr:EamA family transporter [Candidatus Yanofskybacteria bacterium]